MWKLWISKVVVYEEIEFFKDDSIIFRSVLKHLLVIKKKLPQHKLNLQKHQKGVLNVLARESIISLSIRRHFRTTKQANRQI